MNSFGFDFINTVSTQMTKARSGKSGKSGPNNGGGGGGSLNSPIDGAGGKSQVRRDPEFQSSPRGAVGVDNTFRPPGLARDQSPNDPESNGKPVTPGPHPPSPPESPKQRRISLSTRLTGLNTHAASGGSSDGATGAPTSSTAVPSIRDPTAVAVSDLLGTMQNTLKALGNTFDVLGEQTIRVASLGPAVDALSQVCSYLHNCAPALMQYYRSRASKSNSIRGRSSKTSICKKSGRSSWRP